MRYAFAFLMIPLAVFPSYFLEFGTDTGIGIGYVGGWYEIWGGIPYSGFRISKGFRVYGYDLGAGFSISSRLFEENVPGSGAIELTFKAFGIQLKLYGGFSTEEATIVGNSELVGGVFTGLDVKIESNPQFIFGISSVVYGLYRREGSYYFGFAPFGDYAMFPTFMKLGIGYTLSNLRFEVLYTFSTGNAPGVPTPVFNIGGLVLRLRVER